MNQGLAAANAKSDLEVVAVCDHLQNLKFSPTLPYAFTEHGAIMAANVLNSDQAVEMSVHIVRTFVRLFAAPARVTLHGRTVSATVLGLSVWWHTQIAARFHRACRC